MKPMVLPSLLSLWVVVTVLGSPAQAQLSRDEVTQEDIDLARQHREERLRRLDGTGQTGEDRKSLEDKLRKAIKDLTPEQKERLLRELKRRKGNPKRIGELRDAPVTDEKVDRLHHLRRFVRGLPAEERRIFQALPHSEKRAFIEQRFERFREEYLATLSPDKQLEFDELPQNVQDRRVHKFLKRRHEKQLEDAFFTEMTADEKSQFLAQPKPQRKKRYQRWVQIHKHKERLHHEHGEAAVAEFDALTKDQQLEQVRRFNKERKRRRDRHAANKLTVEELTALRDWDGQAPFPIAADRVPEHLRKRLSAMTPEQRARRVQAMIDHPKRRPHRDRGPQHRGPFADLTVPELEALRDWDGVAPLPIASDRLPGKLIERIQEMPAERRAHRFQRRIDELENPETDHIRPHDRRRSGRGPGDGGPRGRGPRPPRPER